jgi:2-haloacid dehalogenase
VPTQPQAYLFDAYGTLFDVDSVTRRGAAGIQGDLQALSQLWRRKQLEYTWQRALMERYEDFWTLTEAALKSAIGQLAIQAPTEQVQGLMQAYLSLDAFDDVKPALEALKESPLAILSNGTPAMLDSLIRHNSLHYFTEVISVDRLRT